MAWFSLAKIALQAGGKIYANRQRAKVAMSDAQFYMQSDKPVVRSLTRENY